MAKYTTQIRTIVESGHPLFDFEYPLFDPLYKKVLEQKIINRYYFREIGLETVGQFKHFLKTKLNEIMPYYNDQYKALEVFKTYDPYSNKDIKITESRTNKQDSQTAFDSETENNSNEVGKSLTKGSGKSSESVKNEGQEVFSDTPQARLQEQDYATNLTEKEDGTESKAESTSEQNTSSTQESKDKASSKAKNTGMVTTTDEYVQTIKGFDGMKYASEVYLGVRETIINIDKQVLDELNDLFMNIY